MEYKDYYKILGVERKATPAEVKKAYKRLARKYHPDVSKEADAEAKFKEVGEAYEVLKDKEKRAAYDELGANWKAGQDFRPPPGWEGAAAGGAGGAGFNTSGFSDFFADLFGGGGAAGGFHTGGGRSGGFKTRGEDQRARVEVYLEDAYSGASRPITLSQQEMTADGRLVNNQRTLNVKIPKGITEGQSIRLKGQGAPGMGGGPKGDLLLEVHFRKHPLYAVDGKDVTIELPVAPWEAALGAKVDVPLPDGKRIKLTLPAGSNTGKQMRLKGKGIPAKAPGDFFVRLKVMTPPAENEASKKAYEDLKAATDYNPRKHLER